MLLSRRYRVYYNPQGSSWYAAFRKNGGRERVSLGARTRPEAEAAVRQLDSPPVTEPKLPDRLTWSQFADLFLQHKQVLGRASGTLKRYRAALEAFRRHLYPLDIAYADQVTLPVLEAYVPFRTGDEGCDAKTAYNDALVLKGAFKWGARPSRGFVPVNPALDWETPEPDKPKRRCYTAGEVSRMETGVRDWLRPIVVMLAWTGMRIDELINLRWEDVNLEERLISIRVQEEWKPKGRCDRKVPMQAKVEAVLRRQPIGKFAFRGPNGGRVKESYALECLKRDQAKLGMMVGDLHGFRRFFATSMLRAGVDVETVRQWGGWKTLETMLRYLADVSATDSVKSMDEAVAKLSAS
ncbi:MAG: site-specific integrase [Planctomycetota bacterium]|nr:site-specific integrase [Planctomycetota bacterium]